MDESRAAGCANVVTGLALSLLLVCGVLVVSDVGTYVLPSTGLQVPTGRDGPSDSNSGSPGAEGIATKASEPRSATPRRRGESHSQDAASARSSLEVWQVSHRTTAGRTRPERTATGTDATRGEARGRGPAHRTNGTAAPSKRAHSAEAEVRNFSVGGGAKSFPKRG